MDPLNWLNYEIFGNSIVEWGTSICIFLALWLMLRVVCRLLRSRLSMLVRTDDHMSVQIAEHSIKHTQNWFLLLFAIAVGSGYVELVPFLRALIINLTKIALLVQVGLWANAALVEFLRIRRERKIEDDREAVAAIDLLGFVGRVGVWSIVLLLTLENLGVDITALIAGLGVGGIAVALASQNILGDLFASLSIVLDKPFVVGDFLIIGEHLGAVERVGLKTTRVRSLSGEQLVFANSDLLNSRIRNFGRMFERRVVFSIGVVYQTSPEKLRNIPIIIRESIEAQQSVRFDRAHFQKYGDFALVFEAVYYVLSPDYNVYMDIQQAINLAIYERFAQDGIDFAYPTQTVFITGQIGDNEIHARP